MVVSAKRSPPLRRGAAEATLPMKRPSAPLLPARSYVAPNSMVEENEYASIEPPRSAALYCYVLLLTVAVLLAVVGFAVTVVRCLLPAVGCPYFTGAWVYPLCACNGALGLAASLGARRRRNLYVAHLAFSVLAFSCTSVAVVLSAANWATLGRQPVTDAYKRPTTTTTTKVAAVGDHQQHRQRGPPPPPPLNDDQFCLIPFYDSDRISYVYQFQRNFDFAVCLWRFKLAVALNTTCIAVAFTSGRCNARVSSLLCVAMAAVSALKLGSCTVTNRRCVC